MRYNSIWLIIVSCLFVACSLDLKPETHLTQDNAFKEEVELNATTTAIHLRLGSLVDLGFQPFIEIGEVASELNEQDLRNWNPKKVLYQHIDWKGIYDLLFNSHYLLDNIHKTEDLSPERRNYHRGQALFALGVGYLALVQRFGNVVLLDNSERLTPYPLSPQLQVLNKAIAYAKEAYDILPKHEQLRDHRGAKLSIKQYASKGTAAALLAHLYAWKGGVIDNYKLSEEPSSEAYKQAVYYATALIDGQAGRYSLCQNPEDLCQKFSDRQLDNPEAIFTFAFDVFSGEFSTSPLPVIDYYLRAYPVSEYHTLADFKLTTIARIYRDKVKEMYSEQDLRRKSYFYQFDKPLPVPQEGGDDEASGDVDNESSETDVEGEVDHRGNEQSILSTYAFPYKWRKTLSQPALGSDAKREFRTVDADYVYWRLADIYLLRAECLAKQGLNAEAVRDLNIIRQRAGAEVYPHNGESDLKLAIFREREKELILEGHRYFDVVRNGLWATELEGKFQRLTEQEVRDGALCFPTPTAAFEDSPGNVINTLIRVSPYWARYK